VSKLTVYSHFGDKELLFSEAIRNLCEELLPDATFKVQGNVGVRAQLRQIAEGFFAMVTSEQAINTHRILLASTQADEHLRQIFWESGPKRTHDSFALLLREQVAQGHLEIEDIDVAAGQFFTLLKGELYGRMMCGLLGRLEAGEIDRHLDATVDMFLRAYARR
jgi:TetR/AcrR family transcriptional repressor of mexJK operon